jgi:hypothetical protein
MSTEKKPRYWAGKITTCDVCEGTVSTMFVDGRMTAGPWANMCRVCFVNHGVGLGTGRGQKYVKQADGKWLKVEG